ncbi:MAG: tRNA lysidine(34) synthetase TilS [Rickettsiales bacterium]|jgi:tRNA(Ile)-lysidine synthase|nr:tRNA lysidine(34) synthetase TilS [Rickettsiales bacterium]
MNQTFVNFMHKYHNSRIAVAVSGGVDSVCLLYWLAELKLDVVALHVNHGLRDAADTETRYVCDLSKKLDIPCHIFHWQGDKPKSNLESAAREARYQLMTDFCRDNNIDVLLTAHQADDQIETFLMNLSRGSGVYGLAAMRDESMRDGIKIVRPLLKVFRSELIEYCDSNGIKYFSDEMNDDEKYTRVRIRKNRHLLDEKLGISDDRVLLAIENLSRTRDGLDEYVENRMTGILKRDYARMDASFLFDEPLEVRLKLLGTLVQNVGGDEYQPRLNSLEKALDMLRRDCKFTLGHCTLRRLADNIVIVPEGSSVSFRQRLQKIN